ncbi:MAG: SHOCT-like domain-containing protein [Bellilinea sp.]
MANPEERLKILQLLQEGKITADQAARLLEALETGSAQTKGAPRPPAAPMPPAAGGGRWLRVRVTDTDTGKTRVNVRLPLNLVASGIRMGMRFAPEIEGLDVNELMSFIQSGESGHLLDVYDDEDGEHVEVYIE